jgi:hypothetical protein
MTTYFAALFHTFFLQWHNNTTTYFAELSHTFVLVAHY